MLQRRAVRLLDHQTRIDQAVARGHLWKADGQLSVTTSVVRFAFEVDRQLETLFYDLVRQKRQLPGVKPRVAYQSDRMLGDHVLQGRGYVDWLPYHLTEKRAKLYLRSGRPFTLLSKQGRKAFEELSLIRNVLAHEGPFAVKRFEEVVINAPTRSVPPHERKVERYLVSQAAPGVSRLEQHMAECVRALKELT